LAAFQRRVRFCFCLKYTIGLEIRLREYRVIAFRAGTAPAHVAMQGFYRVSLSLLRLSSYGAGRKSGQLV
jgi:hypothetical protein